MYTLAWVILILHFTGRELSLWVKNVQEFAPDGRKLVGLLLGLLCWLCWLPAVFWAFGKVFVLR